MAPRKSSRPPKSHEPILLYARLGRLKIYELSEAEFEELARGPSGQLQLNFAPAMLPTALSVLITLQTTIIASNRLYVGYLVAFWALAVQGTISLARWWRSNRDHDRLIRARMPDRPDFAEQLPTAPELAAPEPTAPEDR